MYKIDESIFVHSDDKGKEKKLAKNKKNKKGTDFLEYAKNNGIQVNLQYEDVEDKANERKKIFPAQNYTKENKNSNEHQHEHKAHYNNKQRFEHNNSNRHQNNEGSHYSDQNPSQYQNSQSYQGYYKNYPGKNKKYPSNKKYDSQYPPNHYNMNQYNNHPNQLQQNDNLEAYSTKPEYPINQASEYNQMNAPFYYPAMNQMNPYQLNYMNQYQYMNPYLNQFSEQQPITNPNQSNSEQEESIIGILDYYFSYNNLNKDYYIRSKMDEDGWLNANYILTFNKMKQRDIDLNKLKEVLSTSHSDIIETKTINGDLNLRNKDWDSFKNNLTGLKDLQNFRNEMKLINQFNKQIALQQHMINPNANVYEGMWSMGQMPNYQMPYNTYQQQFDFHSMQRGNVNNINDV